MSRSSYNNILLKVSLIVAFATSGWAQFSPGPLSKAHMAFEGVTNCLECHTLGSSDLAPNCLECHTPIKNRIDDKLGYHGQLEDKTCTKCHREHAGRDLTMIIWDPDKEHFDHKKTGYELTGKHKDAKCDACHKPDQITSDDIKAYADKYPDLKVGILKNTLLGLPTDCSKCHQDVHRGEFKEQTCDKCHTTTDWKAARKAFNHTTQTKYPLQGAHVPLNCDKCHTKLQPKVEDKQVHVFGGLKNYNSCLTCHKDYHHGQFDANCLKCHTMDTFKNPKKGVVDHSKTKFPLMGKHQAVACLECHKSGDKSAPLKFAACSDCHKDHHAGAFSYRPNGAKCDDCHTEQSFIQPHYSLLQHQQTKFPLTGSHLALPCIQCHRDANQKSVYFWQSVACESCHDNPHGAQFDRYHIETKWCESCHTTRQWSKLTFDHAKTNFPLQGRHERIACTDCHKKLADDTIQYAGLETMCESCHRDVHESQFRLLDGINPCEKCHNNETWQIENFDHERLTPFPLTGQHEKVVCEKCHFITTIKSSQKPTVRFTPIAHDCNDCHNFGSK